ncbi:MAG TPA: ArsR family transcriptional regulator [Nitrospinaceae bacterium]|nr:ArsR family transcriptional regulator [Nitrospinaceae bacterium]
MRMRKMATTSWTFLTNHSHVLLCLVQNPFERIRDIAAEVGITERAVQRIIGELEADGYLEHIRDGRRNVYKVFSRKPLRHCIEKHRQVHDLIEIIKK